MIVSPVFSGEPDKKLHEKCIYPTVMVSNSDRSGSSTGTIIRSEKIEDGKYHNVVITTAHGLKEKVVVHVPSYENWSELVGTTMHPALMYYINPKADLAIAIFVSSKLMPTADFGFEEKIYIGNKISRIGCGLGDAPRLEEGILTGISMPSMHKGKVHRMSIHTLPGDSGGAVFHNYKIIGFTQSIRSLPPSNPFVDAEKIYNYAMAVRLQDLESTMMVEKGGIDFVKEGKLPVFAYFRLKTEFLIQGQRAIPSCLWID